MLFFRSEEMLRQWCTERGVLMRPLVTMEQLWLLATAWYATRLREDARRPRPEEMVLIFDSLGLRGDFWDPKSDRF